MKTTIENRKLNKRERRAAQLLAHYATCERLALALGMPAAKVDGKKISVALFKAEQAGAARAVALSCDSNYTRDGYDLSERDSKRIAALVAGALGKLPPGFFVNTDQRGYALKIDNENPEGRALIEAVKLHTDWGGYGILSPEITGN